MRSHLGAALFALLALVAAGCGSDDGTTTGSTTTAGSATTTLDPGSTTTLPQGTTTNPGPSSTTLPSTTEVPPAPVDVNVYWSWTIPTVSAGTPERLGAGGRGGPDWGPPEAISGLLAGPNEIETEIGMGSEIPDGTELLGLTIDDNTAIVDLNGAFETSSGTLAETIRIAQVVFTLTQFDNVDTVAFAIEGVDVDALGSHGFDVSGGLDRDDFADVRAGIMIETPTPGEMIVDDLTIEGEANTFEANVQWTVADADGLIVAEGFTTADAGNGTWGRFEAVVDLPDDLDGLGAVIAFAQSAEDGSQVDVVEYPVRF